MCYEARQVNLDAAPTPLLGEEEPESRTDGATGRALLSLPFGEDVVAALVRQPVVSTLHAEQKLFATPDIQRQHMEPLCMYRCMQETVGVHGPRILPG